MWTHELLIKAPLDDHFMSLSIRPSTNPWLKGGSFMRLIPVVLLIGPSQLAVFGIVMIIRPMKITSLGIPSVHIGNFVT